MARLSIQRTAAAVAVAIASIAAGASPGLAQLAVPAEQPPADFSAAEYVDSAGCVFARVDIGGRIEWVPRVGQDRQQLCGMEPTLAAADTPTPMAQPMPEPVLQAAMPAPAVARVHTPRAPVRTHAHTPPPVVYAPPVQLIPVQVLVPDTVDPGRVRLRAPCPDPASVAAQYLENSIVPGCTTAPAPAAQLVYGTDHPRPRSNHSPVARLRVERPGPPPGYRNVWTDGRLNPYRGIRTVEGEGQMRMVWTDTVPRRLVPAN